MNEYTQKLKDWWATLAPNEKQAVTIGGIVVGFLFFYLIFWAPFLNSISTMRHSIQSDGKTLAWMKAADVKIKKLEAENKPSQQVTSPVVLLSLLQKQMTDTGLAASLTGMKQSGDDSIEMHFQQVEFDRLIKFLTMTVQTYHVGITQLNTTAVESPGVVNADVRIALSSGS